MSEITDQFARLVTIMDELREQCPWDRKQTIQTLRQLTLEETYELADAITENDWQGIKEELGDLMLHIVFYAKIGTEQKAFTLDEVIRSICDKLIARHPHIYGDVKVEDENDVKRNWENLKLKEGKKSVLGGVPPSLPATIKAMRLQEKAKQVGFEWDHRDQVWEKVQEEMGELKEAITGGNQAMIEEEEMEELQEAVASADETKIEEEYGDLIFSLINYARFLHIDAENALELTNKKFISRFNQMEARALQNGQDLTRMSLEEMDAIWNTIKKENKQA